MNGSGILTSMLRTLPMVEFKVAELAMRGKRNMRIEPSKVAMQSHPLNALQVPNLPKLAA